MRPNPHLRYAPGRWGQVGSLEADAREWLNDVLGEHASSPPAASPLESGQGEAPRQELPRLLARMGELRATDLHLAPGEPPCVRVDGALARVPGEASLDVTTVWALLQPFLDERRRARIRADGGADFAFEGAGGERYRCNVFLRRGHLAAAIRRLPASPPPIKELGLPPVVEALARTPRGLVLVTGSTGSGKSTTLAAMVDLLNASRPLHIVTIEDPIEYVHHNRRSLVQQREVGDDAPSFAEAMRQVLRQDPDVILVGEMRDTETIATALTAAETGHLVLATLHTRDAPGAVHRIVDAFEPAQQDQVRHQISVSLQGVVSQLLLPRADQPGRVLATEVLVGTTAVRSMIREQKVHQLRSVMQAGGAAGMQLMEQALARLVNDGRVDLEVALSQAPAPEELRGLLRREPGR
jgi:twitching motility protein PilT